MPSAIFELRNLSLVYGKKTILKNINLKIWPGEFWVFIGPGGGGKSSLLKILAGLIAPTSGEVLFCGRAYHDMSSDERQAALLKMGMLFQKNALFDSLTVGENIAMPLREVSGKPEQEIQEQVRRSLSEVAIGYAKDLYPDEISGGMQKRLGIARALALKPEIVLYDDPTAGLDPITSRMIVDLILQMKKQNKSTVLAVTNDLLRAFAMADQIAVVMDQSVIATGDVASTKSHPDPRIQHFINRGAARESAL